MYKYAHVKYIQTHIHILATVIYDIKKKYLKNLVERFRMLLVFKVQSIHKNL